ncbi:hypothetical protein [Bacillus sp. TYF-LIM-B05]|uniref:hypothetical protein n=1 Tax=Bacillus sp. TYF-LIM-B05 TaxID=2306584 RepID=UPI000F0B2FC3|nr:hypothetical protein [Bacillus sp. TYF-LIM-B05]
MKYVVLKIGDIEKYCSFEQQDNLSEIVNEVHSGRARDNKEQENRYIVINSDEPYAPIVAEIMHLHGHTLGE